MFLDPNTWRRDPPSEVLRQLVSILEEDKSVDAAWLEGSFGRGEEDRYSDIDLHISAPHVTDHVAFAEELLAKVSLPVLTKDLGGISHSLLGNGVRVDAICHSCPPNSWVEGTVRVIFTRAGIVPVLSSEPACLGVSKDQLLDTLQSFWRCVAMLPVVLGRNERIVAHRALSHEVDLAAEFLARCHSGVRTSGSKRLNKFLPERLINELEDILVVPDLSPKSPAKNHLKIAEVIKREGRRYALELGFEYPFEIERTALSFVAKELRLLGIETVVLPEEDE